MASVGHLLDGKYQLTRQLGKGGMGAVYEAINTWTKRRVAIKTLHGELASNKDLIERFWREAQAASKIEHPNIIDVLDMGFDQETGESFIVQEFLVGESLEQRLARAPDGRLPPGEALALIVPIALALVACHAAGIIHRDIKPANIFLVRARDGSTVPKLIDFGISKFVEGGDGIRNTATGATIGTPAYMSPEQASGEKTIDARSDVWSLGVALYEMVSGQLPYHANNVNLLIGKLLYEKPRPLASTGVSLPPTLVQVVSRAVEHDRDARYATMGDFARGLMTCDLPTPLRELAQRSLDEHAPPAANDTLPERTPYGVAPPPVLPSPLVQSGRLAWATTLPAIKRRRAMWGGVVAALAAGAFLVMFRVGAGPSASAPRPVAQPTPTVAPVEVTPVRQAAAPMPATVQTVLVVPVADVPTASPTAPVVAEASPRANHGRRREAGATVGARRPPRAPEAPTVFVAPTPPPDPLAPAQGVYR